MPTLPISMPGAGCTANQVGPSRHRTFPGVRDPLQASGPTEIANEDREYRAVGQIGRLGTCEKSVFELAQCAFPNLPTLGRTREPSHGQVAWVKKALGGHCAHFRTYGLSARMAHSL
jgi:hypothetical protein